ncbi:MAG TPA: 6-phosphogluconolactonase [Flavobacteriaceae bacterium]|uniref:lactonase family protein n=1 Tax=Empedobacter sp. TaxID=1927715 RepID=UPI000E8B19F8|nr:lactonase family protein [Empedobacter sp.]HBX61631.1 6-phosphogluconolactonase [Flavobacteriaceae bacterium]
MKYKLTIFFSLIFSLITYSQTTYVFFGSYNRDTSTDGIYIYSLDIKNGNLKKISTNNSIFNPTFLTLSPNGKFLYACTESQTKNAGSVSSYEFDAKKGTLKFLNSQKSGGENPVFLTVDENGKWLVNVNYTEGSISVYPLSENGIINPATQILQFTEGSGINPKRQDRAHIHSSVFSIDQKYIFFPDLGADKIRSYKFDNLNIQPLQKENFTSSTLGSGPRHLIFHPNGQFAYCIEELAGAISVYKYEKGQLDNIQRVLTHPKDYNGFIMSADIHISPDGNFLYASNRGDQNNISIFSINVDGTLKEVGYQSSLGVHPRIFSIDSSGQFLIVTNLVSGNAFVFRRDLKSGLLKKVGKKVKIKNVSFVQIRKYE